MRKSFLKKISSIVILFGIVSSTVHAKKKQTACGEVKDLATPAARVWGAILSCSGIKLSSDESKLREQLESAAQSFKKGSVPDFGVSPLDFFELHIAREYIYFYGTEIERSKLFNVTDLAADLQQKKDFTQTEAMTSFVGKYWMCSTSSDFEGVVGLLETEMNRDALKTLSTLENTLGALKKIPGDRLCPELKQALGSGNYAWDLLTSLQYEWPVPAKPTPQKKAQLQAAAEKLPPNSDFRKGVEKLLRGKGN